MAQTRKYIEAPLDSDGRPILTKKFLVKACEYNELYSTPKLNSLLYIHYLGIRKIVNLEEYIELKCLYAHNNAINEISGLENLTQLKQLFLQSNCIDKIQGLDTLINLNNLNLSHNFIKKIENLGKLTKLQNFDVSGNMIETPEDYNGLLECPSIDNLNMSQNAIDSVIILDFLAQMKLLCLYLSGNSFIKKMQTYRKKFIYSIPTLVYFDDSPVKEIDHEYAEAFIKEGREGEMKARKLHANIAIEEEKKNREANEKFIVNWRLKKKKALEQINLDYLKKKEETTNRIHELEKEIAEKQSHVILLGKETDKLVAQRKIKEENDDIAKCKLKLEYSEVVLKDLERDYNDNYQKTDIGLKTKVVEDTNIDDMKDKVKQELQIPIATVVIKQGQEENKYSEAMKNTEEEENKIVKENNKLEEIDKQDKECKAATPKQENQENEIKKCEEKKEQVPICNESITNTVQPTKEINNINENIVKQETHEAKLTRVLIEELKSVDNSDTKTENSVNI